MSGCVVIVSEALPEEVRTFALIDGVWICSWPCVAGLATALRVGLIELGKSRLALRGQQEKMEVVSTTWQVKSFSSALPAWSRRL